MSIGDPMIREKIDQVPKILEELDLDMWMLFARESATVHDPSFDLVVGTNVTWHSAFILTRQGDRIAIVGSLDAANVKMHGHYSEVVPYVAGVSDDLRRVLARIDPRRIAVNYSVNDPVADGITHGQWLALGRTLEGTPYLSRIESAERLVAALRGRKTAVEQRLIREACEATVEIFEAATAKLRAGITERQFAAHVRDEMAKRGLEPAWEAEHCPAVFTGPDSAGAHAGPTDRPIEPGHIVNIDFGVKKAGYCSDLQRTWYVLKPGERVAPPAVQKGFDTILKSIRDAAAAIRPGKSGADIDDVARGVVTSAGYAEYPHGTGHQIGRVAHDGGGGLMPRWERYGNTPLLPIEAGQCFTIEPRLTVEGHGIATCEDIVVVKETGAEFLSRSQDHLWLVGGDLVA
jgi:Xaa-Pro aminopeptidase